MIRRLLLLNILVLLTNQCLNQVLLGSLDGRDCKPALHFRIAENLYYQVECYLLYSRFCDYLESNHWHLQRHFTDIYFNTLSNYFSGGSMNRQIFLLSSFVPALLLAISCPVYAGMDSYPDKSGESDATVIMVNSNDISVQLEFELNKLSHEQVSFEGENFDKFRIEGETVAGH